MYDLVIAKDGLRMKLSAAKPEASPQPSLEQPILVSSHVAEFLADATGGIDNAGFGVLPEGDKPVQREIGWNGSWWINARGQSMTRLPAH